ncbi:ATP-binding protein [Sphingobacterium detergens]|uniref:histidine kinase n=1 Tax=Sphingobacterium detergens TaxID=1145106 RepID=A0A420BHN5_SPHD1|nr:ATP-binding protein [Sphingobacterium detergens]RKE56228.1 PAS domain S-box-containing protein [Sphingobacterium detergens]
MIRSDQDILTILRTASGACAIYDSHELHISYASARMLQLWNCDETVLGQRLEDCIIQDDLHARISKLKQVWFSKKPLLEENVSIRLDLEGQSDRYNCSIKYQPLSNAAGEMYGIYQEINIIPHPMPIAQQSDEKNNIEQKLLEDLLTPKYSLEGNIHAVTSLNKYPLPDRETKNLNQKLKAALKKIIESEEHYHFALQSAEMGTWNLNCKSYIVHWDERTRELFGFAKGETVPYSEVLRYIHPEDRNRIDREVKKSLSYQNKGVYDVQFRTIGAEDQKLRWLHCKGKMYFDQDQQPEWFAGTTLDITQQHAEREQLEAINTLIAKKDQEFRMIVEAAGIGIFSIDLESRKMELNDQCRELFGFDHQREIQEVDFFTQILPQYRDKIRHIFQEVVSKQSPFDCQCEIEDKKTGKIKWLRSVGGGQLSADSNRQIIYGAIFDTTNDKEEERKKLDFISIASHELKTPLTSLIAYIQLLLAREQTLSSEKRLQYLHQSNEQATRMRGLIEGFLNVSQLNEGKLLLHKNTFRICTLIDYIRNIYSLKPIKHFIHYTGATDSKQEIVADRDKIEQVIINFIDNAIKYAPTNSTIIMDVLVDDDYFSVKVSDQGRGINDKHQKQIFNKFYRVNDSTDSYASGFGIGLFICREIIQKHQGEIGVDSTLGEGSTFWFKIPIRCQELPVTTTHKTSKQD